MDLPRTTSPTLMVRTSSDLSASLRHPTPDLQSLQGAYVGNIERLEERAERMSASGSDIGEEIRKIQLEQKISDSRRSSLQSLSKEDSKHGQSTRPRNTSASSYANSIVDVNNAARWGGYSPGGYITSPKGSLQSGSWSQTPVKRQRSTSKSSRLGVLMQADDDIVDPDSLAEVYREEVGDPPMPSTTQSTTSSFTKQYDQIAQEIHDQLEPTPVHGVQDDHLNPETARFLHEDPNLLDRPGTAASGDTFHQARTLFEDFDGVHFPGANEDGPGERSNIRQSSLIRDVPVPESHVLIPPPPGDNMIFYPAPVPRLLNLPKRLSQLPQTTAPNKRRTQILNQSPTETRNSVMFPPEETHRNSEVPMKGDATARRRSVDPRKSVISLAGLPPQLRASMFFEQGSVSHELQLKNDSAEATLDSLLEASTLAPVNAFTDHPFAGNVGPEIFSKEKNRQSTATILKSPDQSEARKSRSSLNLLSPNRASTGEPNKLQKRNSRMSIRPDLDEPPAISRDSSYAEIDVPNIDESSPLNHSVGDIGSANEDEIEEQELDSNHSPNPQFHGPPTTLLAELQMRKQQQRSRNRTAATAFPNGMHSTLLELDAVAEVEKKRRITQRVALAWEDPDIKAAEEAEADDDDVPLGMLFPSRDGLVNKKTGQAGERDWDRPLGLIEQRELEDNEPLSRRRNRLLGVDPTHRDPSPAKRSPTGGAPVLSPQTPPTDDEQENETLAQRIRRLKNRDALDQAIEEVKTRPISREFSSEMLSQFASKEETTKPEEPVDEEEETLGQRRARLQREALARTGGAPDGSSLTLPNPDTSRHTLRASTSLADILSANPMKNSARKVSDDQLLSSLPNGSLLQVNEVNKARHKQKLLDQNRKSSYGLDRPLIDLPKQPGMFNANKQTAFKGGLYNNGFGGNMSTPNMLGQGMGMNNYMVQPTYQANMGMQMPYNSAYPLGQMPYQQQQMGLGLGMGMGMTMGMGMVYPPMHGAGMAGLQNPQGIDPLMDQRQRDMIDRWRQSIAP